MDSIQGVDGQWLWRFESILNWQPFDLDQGCHFLELGITSHQAGVSLLRKRYSKRIR